jgi:hypothetical protein
MSTTITSLPEKGTRFQTCPRCDRRRKMRILRSSDETGLAWLNCIACNALVCFEQEDDSGTLCDPRLIGDFGSPAPETFRTYAPEESYDVGEIVYHQTWRDVGKVIRRRELPGGRYAIDVAFLNYGPKMLIVEAEALVR